MDGVRAWTNIAVEVLAHCKAARFWLTLARAYCARPGLWDDVNPSWCMARLAADSPVQDDTTHLTG